MDDIEQLLSTTTIAEPSSERLAGLRSQLVAAAASDGLLDVAYATADTPFGPLLVASTPVGLVRIAFANEPRDGVLGELAARVSPRVLEAPDRLDAVRRELDEYFSGRLVEFDLPLDWSLSSGFRRTVLALTAEIPYGQTVTYRTLAAAAGNPAAVRATGSAMATNPLPIVVPCHRVLRTDGGFGGYRGGLGLKRELLRMEAAGRS